MEQELGVRNICSIMGWVGILHNPTLRVTMYHYILHNVHPTHQADPPITEGLFPILGAHCTLELAAAAILRRHFETAASIARVTSRFPRFLTHALPCSFGDLQGEVKDESGVFGQNSLRWTLVIDAQGGVVTQNKNLPTLITDS